MGRPIITAVRRAFSPSRGMMSSPDVPRWQPRTQCGVTSLKDVAGHNRPPVAGAKASTPVAGSCPT